MFLKWNLVEKLTSENETEKEDIWNEEIYAIEFWSKIIN